MEAKLTTAKKYFEYRMKGKNEEILHLVTDDIFLESERDGKYRGKEEFKRYLNEIKPTGAWGEPVAKEETVVIPGTVRYLMMNWNVLGTCTFDENNLINEIKLARGSLE